MKAYIVEDNESMRMILRRLLKKNFPSFTEIGESGTAEKALEEIPLFKPNLILVDISLPGMDGIEMIHRLKPDCQKTCILVVTGHEVHLYEEASLKAGAHCIVSKSEDEDLLNAIKDLMEKSRNEECG